jgi:hypothetical protein
MTRLGCFIEAWKAASKVYQEYQKKKRLLNKSIDYEFLEKLVQQVNEDPNLGFRIFFKDGTSMEISTRKTRDYSEVGL